MTSTINPFSWLSYEHLNKMNMNINESREYKAAKELERVLNDYSFNPDRFTAANPSFRNFTVRRTIEIHLTTINPQLTQRDAEFYVDGNFYVRGQLDGKYQDFYLTRVKMNYNNRKNSTDNGKD